MTGRSSYPILGFERDADPAGEWIPLAVRMKLDLAGCKIALADWQALALPDRATLLELPVETQKEICTFRECLDGLLADVGASAAAPLPAARLGQLSDWREPGPAPAAVAARLESTGRLADWDRLDRFGRYVLWSLARKDDPKRLTAALDELLVSRPSAG